MQEQLLIKERQALVGELAGAAAHELGQPLSAILLNIHLLQKITSFDGKAETAIQSVKSDVNRMKDIVAELSKIDSENLTEYAEGLKILSIAQKDIK